jgi:proline iminopeptidase
VPLPIIELANLTALSDGRVFEWEAIGEGEPLLWIEGGPGFPAHLARPDVALLAKAGFRTHLVNAPGCGRSSAPSHRDGYTVEAHVEYLEAVRQALGLRQVTIAGHSWGGLIASVYAALHPEALRRLIVIDGYAGGSSVDPGEAEAERERAFDRVRDRPWFAEAIAALEAVFGMRSYTEQEIVDAFRPCWPLYFAEPESSVAQYHIDRIRREIRWNVAVTMAWDELHEAADRREVISGVRAPTLIIVGEHDFVCGPTWNRALAAVIPGARLVEMKGVGHVPQLEAPGKLLSVVKHWLASSQGAKAVAR